MVFFGQQSKPRLRKPLIMNTNLFKKSALTATLVAVALAGLANVEFSLPLVGTVVAYVAAAVLLAFAAFEGARRNS